jgi:hypothetical protein
VAVPEAVGLTHLVNLYCRGQSPARLQLTWQARDGFIVKPQISHPGTQLIGRDRATSRGNWTLGPGQMRVEVAGREERVALHRLSTTEMVASSIALPRAGSLQAKVHEA